MSSTTINQAREAIYKTLVDNWVTTPIVFQDENYTPQSNSYWVRLSMKHLESSQDTLGGVGFRRFVRRSRVFIQVFGPSNAGLKTLDEYATTIAALYEGKGRLENTNMRIYNVTINEGVVDGHFQPMIVEFDIEYEEIK